MMMMVKKNKRWIRVHSSLCCWLYLKRTCYTVFLYTDLGAWYHRSHTELKDKNMKVFQQVRRQQHARTVSPPMRTACLLKAWAEFLLLRCFRALPRRNSRSEVQGGQQDLRKCLGFQTQPRGSHLKKKKKPTANPISPLKGKHTSWKSSWKVRWNIKPTWEAARVNEKGDRQVQQDSAVCFWLVAAKQREPSFPWTPDHLRGCTCASRS